MMNECFMLSFFLHKIHMGCFRGVFTNSLIGIFSKHVNLEEAHGGLVQVVVVDTQFDKIFIFFKPVPALPCLLHKPV